jgi:hypothetical protein
MTNARNAIKTINRLMTTMSMGMTVHATMAFILAIFHFLIEL